LPGIFIKEWIYKTAAMISFCAAIFAAYLVYQSEQAFHIQLEELAKQLQ